VQGLRQGEGRSFVNSDLLCKLCCCLCCSTMGIYAALAQSRFPYVKHCCSITWPWSGCIVEMCQLIYKALWCISRAATGPVLLEAVCILAVCFSWQGSSWLLYVHCSFQGLLEAECCMLSIALPASLSVL
jgi:hypothetical protein